MRISDWSSDVCSSDLARRHRPVADHRDRTAGFVLELVGDRKAQRRADRGRRMRRAERVIVALAALGEARNAAAGPQGPDTVAEPGDDIVRHALVDDAPHDLVARREYGRASRRERVGQYG